MKRRQNRRVMPALLDLLLVALILFGVTLRFSWTNWSQGASLHPDEYGLTNTLTQLRMPDSLADYFNTRISPISPYHKYDEMGVQIGSGPDNRMRWGQWPIIIIRQFAEWTGNTGYDELRLMGRQLSATADVLALILIFFIGARLYNERTGLLAAALSALAVMQVQQSHFMTADNFAVFFTALAMLAATMIATHRGRSHAASVLWYVLFGIALGMTVASRINLAPLAGLVVIAALVAVARREGLAQAGLVQGALRVLPLLALAAVVSLATFRVTQPMTFRAPTGDTTLLTLHFNQDWSDSMAVALNESRGIGAGPPGEQWVDRAQIIFPLMNMVVWGMGLALGLSAWGGFGWALARSLRVPREWRMHILPLVWVGGYFLFMGTRHVMAMRYFLPVYPFLALLGAWALLELVRPRASGYRARPLGMALLGLVLLFTMAWVWGFVSAVYLQENTRIRASRWMFHNIIAPVSLTIATPEGEHMEPLAVADGLAVGDAMGYAIPFTAPVSGVPVRVDLARVLALDPSLPPGRLKLTLTTDPEGNQVLARALLPPAPPPLDWRGAPLGAPLEASAPLVAGQAYYLVIEVSEGSALAIHRPVLANENWDESLPVRIDNRDPFGMYYRGINIEVRWHDDENKRRMYYDHLAMADYLVLPSQRGIWSISRLPEQYPMTMEYYRALFAGELGFELVAQFHHPWRFGPLQISDLGGTWAWSAKPELPLFNTNFFAAEEAFSVYDHAPVWIFKKTPEFSVERVREVLGGIELP
ncbi:MAG TPA: phospholipid carrier-dependent glycosyltransferase [Levilinea sp.]|nr:phospholipid carrier-dependent glycosyltransferase [Levilinea sp.]